IMVVGFNLSTQAQEVAHIDVSELIPSMPESKAAQTELTNLQEKYRKEMETMQKDFEAKLKKYQEEAPTTGDALNETRGREMQECTNEINKLARKVKKRNRNHAKRSTS